MGVIYRNYLRDIELLGRSDDGVSSNCVQCGDPPDCPTCPDDEECRQVTQSCNQCATATCVKKTSDSLNDNKSTSSSDTAKIGGIAGGVAAFVIILLVIGLFFIYKKWYKKKYPHGFFYYYEDDDEETQDKEALIEDRSHAEEMAARRQSQMSSANSVFTRASNIINVAYIPGVTVRNPKVKKSDVSSNRALSIFSRETYFSDLENASINGGHVAVRGATPVLVKVEKDSYNFDEPGNDSSSINNGANGSDNNSTNNNSDGNSGISTAAANAFKVTKSGYRPGLQQQFIIEEADEEEEESDDEIDNNNELGYGSSFALTAANMGSSAASSKRSILMALMIPTLIWEIPMKKTLNI
ncbi:unnamed protein product [Ambrosiozyma monospora]|uniref:Unnamed protein product n=1 Tax=Ambrosiozyma monospora TaxID=43982 RepID=A0ACB5U5X1_AMBMO|nr:unnamed protein product [Ambrosiozyma monospora]